MFREKETSKKAGKKPVLVRCVMAKVEKAVIPLIRDWPDNMLSTL